MQYCENDYCANVIPCSVHQLQLIDVHIHLLDAVFDIDREALLQSAHAAGVASVTVVSETVDQATAILKLARQWSTILPVNVCCGIHPCYAHLEEVSPMLELIRSNRHALAGVGEIGLDFTPHVLLKQLEALKQLDPSATEEAVKGRQRAVFGAQLQLAKELDLCVNVHSRNAGHHAIAMVAESGVDRAVFHAFDGKPVYAERAAREHKGYVFSVPPSIVREPSFQGLVRAVPLSQLVLETDAPALPPVQRTRNIPENLRISCSEVARLKRVPEQHVAAVTSANARQLFALH